VVARNSTTNPLPLFFHLFSSPQSNPKQTKSRAMTTKITEGVEFDTIAREWRCKWSADHDKQSLADAQKLLNSILPDVKAVDGVQSVQRVVCGGCLDFKVVTSLHPPEKFKAWEAASFSPEADFLEKLRAIDGISVVETQTYTLMPM
jgi:hypothetical protein